MLFLFSLMAEDLQEQLAIRIGGGKRVAFRLYLSQGVSQHGDRWDSFHQHIETQKVEDVWAVHL
jgi:hypothetical protein